MANAAKTAGACEASSPGSLPAHEGRDEAQSRKDDTDECPRV